MKENLRSEVERIAARVAEDGAVDWDLERTSTPELARLIRQLDRIRKVAGAYREDVRGPGRDAAGAGDAASPEMGTPEFTWSGLLVFEEIGRGGFGTVHRAFDPQLHREVALKLRTLPAAAAADPGASVERFLGEARHLARVRHPNVVTVFGAAASDGRVGIWTELLQGRTLEEQLAESGPGGAGEAMLAGLDLVRALAAVHASGLVHGDVKASNVMRERGGTLKLLDFGSGHGLEAGERSLEDRPTGTPLAMAPEVLFGGAPTPRSDLYALGALLYRMLTGRYPVEARSITDLLAAHAARSRTPLRDLRPDLPLPVVRAVERALEPDAERRFASAGEMELALAEGLESAGARTPAPAPRVAAPAGARAWAARPATVIAGGLLLVAVAVAAWFAWRAREAGAPAGGAAGEAPAVAPVVSRAALFRQDADGATQVRTGSVVGVGELFFLEVETRAPAHLYVLGEDEAGETFLLFPVPGFDAANPLPASSLHRLPGRRDGVPQYWEITSAGGHETLLLVASPEPLPNLERVLAGVPVPRTGGERVYAALTAEAMDGLRAMGAVRPRPEGVPAATRLADVAAALRDAASGTPGLWTEEIVLRHRAP